MSFGTKLVLNTAAVFLPLYLNVLQNISRILNNCKHAGHSSFNYFVLRVLKA